MPILSEFNKNDLLRLTPTEFSLEQEISNIFSVPFKNSIGTNDLDNAITLLHLKGKNIKYIQKQKDFVEMASLDEMFYLPILSKKKLAYTLTRELIVCDFKKNNTSVFTICDDSDEIISDAGVLDIAKNHYWFEITRTYFETDGKLINEKIYKACDLSANTKKEIAELDLGEKDLMENIPWAIQNGKLIYYTQEQLQALNSELKPTQHPLVDLYKQEAQRIGKLSQIHIHPTYPLALLVSEDQDNTLLYCADWGIKPAKILLLTDKLERLQHADFSPTGDWLVLCNQTKKDKYEYFIMNINRKYFSYIGPLLGYLGEIDSPSTTAWIKKPLSFVVSQEEKLLKWEINKSIFKK